MVSRTWDIDPATLYRSYADHRDHWTGCRLRLVIPANDYRVVSQAAHWYPDSRDQTPPAIIFRGFPPPDSSVTVIVVGVCRGRENGTGPIVLEDCSFNPHP